MPTLSSYEEEEVWMVFWVLVIGGISAMKGVGERLVCGTSDICTRGYRIGDTAGSRRSVAEDGVESRLGWIL